MSNYFAFLLTVALTLSAGPATVRAAAPAASDWRTLRSPNFLLVGNASEGAMKRVALDLEQFRQGLKSILPQARVESTTPTTVYVFKDDNAFMPYKPKLNGKPRREVGGYFLMQPEGNYVALAGDGGSSEGHQVIYHEYVHFLTRSGSRGLPLWLNEGLAEFYSTFDMRNGGRTMRIGSPIPWHVVHLRRGALIPLETLLEADKKSPYYTDARKTGQFYAQSWLLTHFLMLGNEGKLRAQIGPYIAAVAKGMPVAAAFEQAFGLPIKKAEQELHGYLNKALVPITEYQVKGEPLTESDLRVGPLAEGEANALLAELLLRMGYFEEAEAHIAKAVAAEMGSDRALATLGEIRFRQWKIDEAVSALEAAVRKGPENAVARLHLGDALYRAGRYAEAGASYAEAVRLRPDLETAYLGLGLSYTAVGKEAEAASAFEAYAKVEPEIEELHRRRAYIYLGNGRGTQAAGDAIAFIAAKGWKDESSHYLALVAHFGLRETEHDAEARQVLDELVKHVEPKEWIVEIANHLLGKTTAEELLRKATDNDKQTEAHAYIGLDLLNRGEREAAIEHLAWVREKGNRRFVEYDLAVSVLRRLESGAKASGAGAG